MFFFKDFIKIPQTTIALTFLTHIISGIDGVKYLRARLVQAILGRTCLRAGLVSGLELVLGPDLSQGRTCLGAGPVQKLRGRKCPKTSGPEVTRGWKCLGATKTYSIVSCSTRDTPPRNLCIMTLVSILYKIRIT